MEEERSIRIVGNYSLYQVEPKDCIVCKNAKYATVLVDGKCLDCLLTEGRIKINLCDDCVFDVPTCKSDNVVFGCDDGGQKTDDNIVKCDTYSKKIKGWKCLYCGYGEADNRQLDRICTKCKKHR